jgi:hypothetical protein
LILFITVDKEIDRQQRKQLETDQRIPDAVAIFPIQNKANARDQATSKAEAAVKSPKKPDGPGELQSEILFTEYTKKIIASFWHYISGKLTN